MRTIFHLLGLVAISQSIQLQGGRNDRDKRANNDDDDERTEEEILSDIKGELEGRYIYLQEALEQDNLTDDQVYDDADIRRVFETFEDEYGIDVDVIEKEIEEL